jgi:ribosomal protein S18 acetylase RimI-like enzyme
VEIAIGFGREAGYRAMRLDTLPSMAPARELYRRIGFRDVAPYNDNPISGASFMELVLQAPEEPP